MLLILFQCLREGRTHRGVARTGLPPLSLSRWCAGFPGQHDSALTRTGHIQGVLGSRVVGIVYRLFPYKKEPWLNTTFGVT